MLGATVVLSVVTIPMAVFCDQLHSFIKMESYNNSIGNINILEQIDLRDYPTACWRICHRNSHCSSYFENMFTGECRLMSTNLTKEDLVEETGWNYFVKMRRKTQAETVCQKDQGFNFDEDTNLCFKLLTEEKLYRPAAIANCTKAGGRLMQIKNEMQHKAAVKYMEKYYSQYSPCIDGRRPDLNGTFWTFENGEALSYFKWGPDQPQINRRCIRLAKSNNFNWASATCSVRNLYLCEISSDKL